MGFFKKKRPEQAQSQPQSQQETPLEKMDPLIRPGGVFMVQLLMKEKCETPAFSTSAAPMTMWWTLWA